MLRPMKRKAVGFYWTLPVPWAGFTSLPREVDRAAGVSRTIAYQRELIRQYVRGHGFHLIYEEAFLEIEPDRGSELVWQPLDKIAKHCREHDATLLFVDFSMVGGWRTHNPMRMWPNSTNIPIKPIFPSEIVLNGQMFDPHEHFRAWQDDHAAWAEAKPQREAMAWESLSSLRESGCNFPEIAQQLNAAGVQTPTGKLWTKDNLIKFALKCVAKPVS